jgi:hypothetical protein
MAQKGLSRPLLLALALAGSLFAGTVGSMSAACGPFTDVASDAFCSLVLEIFTIGITTGTTATTYDPTANVNRLQMAAFLSRTVDGVLKRGSRRAAMNQFWTPQSGAILGTTSIASVPRLLQFDGTDVWVTASTVSSVFRVRGSDGKLLETWTGAVGAWGPVVAMNKVLVTGIGNPGRLHLIDPTLPPGAVTTVASNLGGNPTQAAFDGGRVWTANNGSGSPGSVSIVTPGASIPWTVTSVIVSLGATSPAGIVFDGANIWVADAGVNTLVKLDAAGSVLQTVTVGTTPQYPTYDGTSVWVPNFSSNTVTVVRGSSGAVLQTLTGNGLSGPTQAAFDGERILVTNHFGDSVSLWKAADLTVIGNFQTGGGSGPEGACSDGIRFWIGMEGSKIARF